jgi:hypothetical protein
VTPGPGQRRPDAGCRAIPVPTVHRPGGMMEPPFATLADEIASVPSKVTAATSGADDQALRRRPEPGEWSALEVVGHLVDKMRIWRARVQAIAVEERPRIDLYDQDALVTAQSYRTAAPRSAGGACGWLSGVRRHRQLAPRGDGPPERHPSRIRGDHPPTMRPDPPRIGGPASHPASWRARTPQARAAVGGWAPE